MPRQGLLIISGPSGAGKTTLSKALVDAMPNIEFAVSHTTRPPRPGEIDGRDYYFVADEEFDKLLENSELLEYADVYNYRYGTSRQSVERPLAKGKTIILDIDWQGNRHIRQLYPDAVSIFILPPASNEAEQRLRARQQDSETVITDRMKLYAEQMSHQDEFDHIIINEDIPRSLQQLITILEHE